MGYQKSSNGNTVKWEQMLMSQNGFEPAWHTALSERSASSWLIKHNIKSRRRNTGTNKNNIAKRVDKLFGNMATFKYLGVTVTDRNDIHEEIKIRLNSGNSCYHSVQNLSCFRFLSKSLKIKIYKTLILRVILYGCEIWLPTLTEEHRTGC
jgi:hypothetical protein